MKRTTKTYHPGKIKTDRTIRHYGLLERDLGPKMDGKFVGESWNLVQRRLRMMEQRDGSEIVSRFEEGGINWGKNIGGIRAMQAGSMLYADTSVEYGYTSVELLLGRFGAMPFDWPGYYPKEMEATCESLWDANPTLKQYKVAANADLLVVPSKDHGPHECWSITCEDLWEMYPESNAYRNMDNREEVVWPVAGDRLAAWDCWNTKVNYSLPDYRASFNRTLQNANDRNPHTYDLAGHVLSTPTRFAGYDLVGDRVLIPIEDASALFPITLYWDIEKTQTELFSRVGNKEIAKTEMRSINDILQPRRSDPTKRIYDASYAMAGDYTVPASVRVNGFAGASQLSLAPLFANAPWRMGRTVSKITFRHRIVLYGFRAVAEIGDSYTVSVKLNGVNRHDENIGDKLVKEITVQIVENPDVNAFPESNEFTVRVTGRLYVHENAPFTGSFTPTSMDQTWKLSYVLRHPVTGEIVFCKYKLTSAFATIQTSLLEEAHGTVGNLEDGTPVVEEWATYERQEYEATELHAISSAKRDSGTWGEDAYYLHAYKNKDDEWEVRMNWGLEAYPGVSLITPVVMSANYVPSFSSPIDQARVFYGEEMSMLHEYWPRDKRFYRNTFYAGAETI